MTSKVKIFGHALHPMITPFPIAFNTATMVCCIVYAENHHVFWFHVAFVANCAAIATSVIAIIPGLIDWLSVPELTDAKSTGLQHMIANVIALGLFTANAGIMYSEINNHNLSSSSHVMMTLFGFLVMMYAGFKGWKMVQTHHVGVDMRAHEEIPEQGEVEKNASEIFTDAKEQPSAKRDSH